MPNSSSSGKAQSTLVETPAGHGGLQYSCQQRALRPKLARGLGGSLVSYPHPPLTAAFFLSLTLGWNAGLSAEVLRLPAAECAAALSGLAAR